MIWKIMNFQESIKDLWYYDITNETNDKCIPMIVYIYIKEEIQACIINLYLKKKIYISQTWYEE